MKTASISLTIFDFLGYFVPGALFVYMVMIVASFTAGTGRLDWVLQASVAELVPFFVVAYVSGHVLSVVSSLTVEEYATQRKGQPSRYLFGEGADQQGTGAVNLLRGAVLWPISLPHIALSRAVGIEDRVAKPMSPPLAKALRESLPKRLDSYGVTSSEVGPVFPLLQHMAVEIAPTQAPRLARHIALSGFMRSTSLLAVVAAWSGLILVVSGRTESLGGPAESVAVFILVPWVLAYLSFLAFVKFNRRFAFETLMVFLLGGRSFEMESEASQATDVRQAT